MSTLKFLADENFASAILRGLLRRSPQIDVIRVQDIGMTNTEDTIILDWAAQNDRIVLTHDLRTMPGFAYARIAQKQKMPGLIVMKPDIRIGTAIDDILLIVGCMTSDELKDGIFRLPI